MKKKLLVYCSIMMLALGLTVRAYSSGVTGGGEDSADLTISYLIEVVSKSSKNEFGESYNGAVKTVFASDKSVRLRLVSLMRIQSVIIEVDEQADSSILFVNESGKKKAIQKISSEHWNLLHKKYEGSKVVLLRERVIILGYECKMAKIVLTDDSFITVCYTDKIQHSLFQHAEPMFKDIPGVVLKYEYQVKKSTLSYTATQLSRNKIKKDVFDVK